MSLSTTIQEAINSVVSEWISSGKMFTAFEISLEVKKRGIQERHRNLRDVVHETIFRIGIERGDYTRTLMDVGAPDQAWVYHTVDANPYDYVPLDREGMDPILKQSRPRGVRNPIRLTPNASPFAIPIDAYGTDQRGRLCIPVSLLTQIGVSSGQRVNVLCDPANEQAIITKDVGNAQGNPDTSYTVEADGNVRVSQSTLEKAALDGMQCYRIDGNNTIISIRKYS